MLFVSLRPAWGAENERIAAIARLPQGGKLLSPGANDVTEDGQQVSESEEFSQKEEKRVLDLLAQGLSQDFPNPERVGCPDAEVLRGIALRKLPLTEVRRWLDHLGTCSPCFQQASEFRKEAERQRRRRKWTVAGGTAILLLAIGVWVWIHTRKPATEVLDLRQVPAVNPRSPTAQEQQTLLLYRWARHLTIELPAGSKPGIEEVAIFSETDVEIFDTTASARMEREAVYVEVDIDVSSFEPGQYFLGVREPGVTWSAYRVRIP